MKLFCEAIQEHQREPNYNGIINWTQISEKIHHENKHLVPAACIELWNFIAFGKDIKSGMSDKDLGVEGSIEVQIQT